MGGCATNATRTTITITEYEEGVPTYSEANHMTTFAAGMLWFEQDGKGDASFKWSDDGGELRVGQQATGQKSDVPAGEILKGLGPLLGYVP